MLTPNKIYVAKVVGSFLLDLFCYLYRNWGALHHDVVGIQATFDQVESGERSKDRSRAMQQWFHISAMIIMGSLQSDTYVILLSFLTSQLPLCWKYIKRLGVQFRLNDLPLQ
jgi:hypothetical protein